jgi:hypothetical protein
MYKVRIKKNARPGDQKDYSLHTGFEAVHSPASGMSAENNVRHTMGAVPKEDATIEVEGGETVVGDVNTDGYLEHFEFKGKRHNKGGMPVNIPEGSFIFSDTRKLAIRDKTLLKEVFNKSGKRGGYTPAELSKEYKLNHFISTLRDDKSDDISKATANLMVQKNLKKLGELALVQESMKGFQNGIPAIAEFAMGTLSEGSAQESQNPMMRNGGTILPKMQIAGITVGQKATDKNEKSYFSKLFDFVVENSTKSHEQQQRQHEAARKNYMTNMESYEKNYAVRQAEEDLKKQQEKISSGNKRVDEMITAYRQNPTKRAAKKLMEFIEEAYPETRKESKFLYSIPGYQDSFLENPYVKKAYQDAMFHYDASYDKSDDYKMTSQSEIMNSAKSFYIDAKNKIKAGDLLPFEKNELERELQKIEKSVVSGKYDIHIDRWYNSRKKLGYNFEDMETPSPDIKFSNDDPDKKDNSFDFKTSYNNNFSYNFDNQIDQTSFKENLETDPQHTDTQRRTPELPANERPVSASAQTGQKIGSYTLKAGARIIGEMKYGGIVKYQLGDVVKSPSVKIVANPDGTYEVVDFQGRVVFSTYNNPGNKTPGGIDSSYPDMKPEEFVNWYKGWVKAMGVEPNEIKGNEDFQERMYSHILENDPESIEKTWGSIGLNRKAMQDKNLVTKLIDLGVLNPETNKLDFSKVDSDTKKTLFKEMGNHYNDGMVGVRSLNMKPPAQEETPVTETKPVVSDDVLDPKDPDKTPDKDPGNISGNTSVDHINSKLLAQAPVKKNGPWYMQDQMNLAAAMTDRVNRYEPLLSQIDASYADPVFKDPSRAIAASQEQQAQMYDILGNSMDPATASAMAIGASGQGFANVANVLAQTENENVNIANQFASNNAQIDNAAKAGNAQLLQKYVAEMATLNQNTDNSNSLKKYRTLAAWNNGTNNWFRKKIMEQVLFPQVYQNPINGNIDFSGTGRDPSAMDIYANPIMGGQNPQNVSAARAMQLKQELDLMKDFANQGYDPDSIKFLMGRDRLRNTPGFNDAQTISNAYMGVVPQNVQLTPN